MKCQKISKLRSKKVSSEQICKIILHIQNFDLFFENESLT